MPLATSDINPSLLKVEYAVRGEFAIKAEEYRERLKLPDHGLPFGRVIGANIGNPQALGLDQKPITFSRQVRRVLNNPCMCSMRIPDVFAR